MNSSISSLKKEKKLLLEKYLDESLNRYRSLFACDSDAIYAMDLNGYFIPLNPACEDVFGYELEKLGQISYMKVVTIEHLERALSFFYKSIEGKLENFDCQIVHKNGELRDINITTYPILVNGEIVGVYGVAKDITEIKQRRKKFTEEIQQREKIYRDIVEHSPDAVIITRQELILFANDTAVKLVGAANQSELIGKTIYDFVDDRYFESALKQIKAIEDGYSVDFIEEKLVRKDGKKIEVEIKAIPAIFQNEPARHIIIRDISERKKTQEYFLQSEKLSVAGQLAAGIAHEIRNPLTAIKGFLQLMNADLDVKGSYFDIIQSEMNRIELILGELLLLAKPQEMKFSKVNLLKVLQHVKALIDTQAIMKNIEVAIVYKTDNMDITCDENHMKQVFINFLKNSIEAMPNGGKILIEVEDGESNSVRIRFKDQGSGIPEENLDRIFQPFFTTKEAGTGLGLMINRQIIKNHNGTIQVSSNQSGTTVEVEIPL